jgi:hypothetical protein
MPYKDPIKRREHAKLRMRKWLANPENKVKSIERNARWKEEKEDKEHSKEVRKQYRAANRETINKKRRIYQATHKDRVAARYKAWRQANPEKTGKYSQRLREKIAAGDTEKLRASQRKYRVANRDKTFLRLYGIDQQQWNELFEAQGKRCAICKTEEGGPKGFFHTDHCHTTNKVRGILCHKCNLMLGLAKDSVYVLTTAIAYLTKEKTCA